MRTPATGSASRAAFCEPAAPLCGWGQVHATVEQTGKHTFFGRTATLLQSVDSMGSLQRVLMRVVTVLLVRGPPPEC